MPSIHATRLSAILGLVLASACSLKMGPHLTSPTSAVTGGASAGDGDTAAEPDQSWREPPARTTDAHDLAASDYVPGVPTTEHPRPTARVQDMPPGIELGEVPRSCTAAENHCLPADAWFVVTGRNKIGVSSLTVTHESGGRFFPYRGEMAIDGVAVRTIPATAAAIKPGVALVVYDNAGTGRVLPKHEYDATADDSRWKLGIVASVDLASGTLMLAGAGEPSRVESARLPVEQRAAQ